MQKVFRRAVSVPASLNLEKGTVVRLKGLSRPDLNDREGTVTATYSAQRGRYDVSVDGTDGLRVRPVNLRVQQEVRIACVLACHVDSTSRLEGLQRCLESIRQQTMHPHIFLSVSAAREFMSEARDLIVAYGPSNLPQPPPCSLVVIFQGATRLSQFQHHQKCLERLSEAKRKIAEREEKNVSFWVLFSGDEGIWHPKRLETYAGCLDALLSRVETGEASCRALALPWCVVRAPDASDVTFKTAAQVDSLIETGEAKLWNTSGERRLDTAEFWSTLVEMEHAVAFFRLARYRLIADSSCDLAFRQHAGRQLSDEYAIGPKSLLQLASVRYEQAPSSAGWLYAHSVTPAHDTASRQPVRGWASVGGPGGDDATEPSSEDFRLAEGSKSPIEAPMPVEEIAKSFARIRHKCTLLCARDVFPRSVAKHYREVAERDVDFLSGEDMARSIAECLLRSYLADMYLAGMPGEGAAETFDTTALAAELALYELCRPLHVVLRIFKLPEDIADAFDKLVARLIKMVTEYRPGAVPAALWQELLPLTSRSMDTRMKTSWAPPSYDLDLTLDGTVV
jgi:hypothetical protein